MSTETFEALASLAEREEEGLRLEFLGGRLGVRPLSDGIRTTVTTWLVRLCAQRKPQWGLYVGLGLKVGTDGTGRAIPAGTLAPMDHFAVAGEWAEPDGVLLTVEVTSFDRDTTQRDRIDKPRAYAESAIPVYLLIDRDTREVTVHSEPDGGAYQKRVTVPFGKTVTLPEPVGIELHTQQLLAWVQGEGA